MKKVTFLLVAMLIGGMMMTGCKKNPQPTPTPTPTTKTLVYKMDNTFKQSSTTTLTLSPGFHYKFSYKDANGTMVEVNDPTLPWSKEITVTTPFEAKLEGNVTYNENELPTEGKVNFGTLGSISTSTDVTPSTNMSVFNSKQQFLDFISTHSDKLNYSFTLSIK